MADLFGREHMDELQSVPARRLGATTVKVLANQAPEDFRTTWTAALKLSFEGIPGGRHAGHTRRSGSREPWYPRGTEMCNERQVSILSVEELAEVAADMGLPRIEAEWIGGNILLEGLPRLSLVPPRTRLVFAGGAVLRVDGDNMPCRIAGASIAVTTRVPSVSLPITAPCSLRMPSNSAARGDTTRTWLPELC